MHATDSRGHIRDDSSLTCTQSVHGPSVAPTHTAYVTALENGAPRWKVRIGIPFAGRERCVPLIRTVNYRYAVSSYVAESTRTVIACFVALCVLGEIICTISFLVEMVERRWGTQLYVIACIHVFMV